jgi:hypothetical protein
MALYNLYSVNNLRNLGVELGHPKLASTVEDLTLVMEMLDDARHFSNRTPSYLINNFFHRSRLDAMKLRITKRGYSTFAEFWRMEICGSDYYDAINALHSFLSRAYVGPTYSPANTAHPLYATDHMSEFVCNLLGDYRPLLTNAFQDAPTVEEFFEKRLWLRSYLVWGHSDELRRTVLKQVPDIPQYLTAFTDMLQYCPEQEEKKLVAFCMAFHKRLGNAAAIGKYLGGHEGCIIYNIWVEYQSYSPLFRKSGGS